MIGKHFLVYNMKKKGVKRHYTICNSLKPDVYEYYLKLVETFKQKKEILQAAESLLD